MTELDALRRRAAAGDRDAASQLTEAAVDSGDMQELRWLSDAGYRDATDHLVELAGERGDMAELARLSDAGHSDATDQLVELTGEREDRQSRSACSWRRHIKNCVARSTSSRRAQVSTGRTATCLFPTAWRSVPR